MESLGRTPLSQLLMKSVDQLSIISQWIFHDHAVNGSKSAMISPCVQIAFAIALAGGSASACAQIKEAGRTIGHTTRDVTREIGHGARAITREIGHGTRDAFRGLGGGSGEGSKPADEEVKTVVKPAPIRSEY
jgi:hypothetical protein